MPKHVFITAGSKGIGRKVTETLVKKGYSVTVNYRQDHKAVETLTELLQPYSNQLLFIQGDITKEEDIKRMVHEATETVGPIDILINNAGPYIFERKKLIDYSNEEWYEMIEGNLSSVFHLLKLIVPTMRENKFGRIITYGFQGADTAPGWIYRSAFSAAKVGLVSLTKTIAFEEAEHGITANMVCPGDILGEMKEASIEYARNHSGNNAPIGRSGTGEDIARMIEFLCDENSDMMTGSIIEITGGVDVINRYR
ncbi:3-oxoacyl-[acyl-carrier protein] reductase [Bacillus mesophilus]|uniref:SDR family oxidoreductase n=1 Tax=Bacillus mesophilus TaxID=1808955 RepID=A0A6M0Q8S5_9BACI|nr:SDR family oxidoreductase [Bacillus mesophilus]MBM7660542.1 3-oxoacyl-[acyl-carrier protein] reductase [Bacillus mesophilus]NEY71910.1 SDR family oxidoreductase [Bacillus mesophilus]